MYIEPSKTPLSEWLETWLETYVKFSVKPYTFDSYTRVCEKHIDPILGSHKLSELNPIQIQQFYNRLLSANGLSPKTIKNIHGVLHRALQQALKLGMIKQNPSDLCDLPKVQRKEIKPLEQEDIVRLVKRQTIHNSKQTSSYDIIRTGSVEGKRKKTTFDSLGVGNLSQAEEIDTRSKKVSIFLHVQSNGVMKSLENAKDNFAKAFKRKDFAKPKVGILLIIIILSCSLLAAIIIDQITADSEIREITAALPGHSFTGTYYERYGFIITGTTNHYITLKFNNNSTLLYYHSTKLGDEGELCGTYKYTVTRTLGIYEINISTNKKITVRSFKLTVGGNYTPLSVECTPKEGKEWSV